MCWFASGSIILICCVDIVSVYHVIYVIRVYYDGVEWMYIVISV